MPKAYVSRVSLVDYERNVGTNLSHLQGRATFGGSAFKTWLEINRSSNKPNHSLKETNGGTSALGRLSSRLGTLPMTSAAAQASPNLAFIE